MPNDMLMVSRILSSCGNSQNVNPATTCETCRTTRDVALLKRHADCCETCPYIITHLHSCLKTKLSALTAFLSVARCKNCETVCLKVNHSTVEGGIFELPGSGLGIYFLFAKAFSSASRTTKRNSMRVGGIMAEAMPRCRAPDEGRTIYTE